MMEFNKTRSSRALISVTLSLCQHEIITIYQFIIIFFLYGMFRQVKIGSILTRIGELPLSTAQPESRIHMTKVCFVLRLG